MVAPYGRTSFDWPRAFHIFLLSGSHVLALVLMLEPAQGFWLHLATFLAPCLENNAYSLVPFSARNGSGDGA